ncbi:MAG TPA: amidohydrolase family protein [Steroidobacteraceae bacterium]|nr:amidohydrolase family protein [Steroidobacteraceae bacterium]
MHALIIALASTVIINAQVADGTGAALRKANVRITEDRIAAIGNFEPARGDEVIDAKGLVLAPGFIDIHNHSEEGLDRDPLATTQIAQGITTVLLGADGDSPWPIGSWLEQRRGKPVAMNLAVAVGHATVREQILQNDFRRVTRPTEIAAMAKLVEQGMREGAIGLSSGLEYDVASYSTTEEMVAVAEAAAKHGGFYMTHIRDEADRSFEALREEIAIGQRARIPVQHSHIKLGTVSVWGRAAEYVKIIEDARRGGLDFLADCYPYDAWYSTIKVLVPDKQYESPSSVKEALAAVGGAGNVTIANFAPNKRYEQHTIEQLAQDERIDPIDMFIRIIREGNAADDDALIIAKSMTDADIELFYKQPWVMVASDGGIDSQHPRGAGTFPRVLGRFVRERHWFTLPEAVRKMTSLPAQRMGLPDRGTLRKGTFADLVLFDPETVIDRATFAQPFELPVGVKAVFVNGVKVWSEDKPTGEKPGRVLTR